MKGIQIIELIRIIDKKQAKIYIITEYCSGGDLS